MRIRLVALLAVVAGSFGVAPAVAAQVTSASGANNPAVSEVDQGDDLQAWCICHYRVLPRAFRY
jgi:hypothetical protein